MQNLAILLAGFSVFYAFNLSLTHFYCDDYKENKLAQIMGIALVMALAGLQLSHFLYLVDGNTFIHTSYYVTLLFLVAPCFYLFSKPLLTANNSFHFLQLLHFSPIIIAFVLPRNISMQIAFVLGGVYLVWLAGRLYALRKQRVNFRRELFILAVIFVIAILALILGLVFPIFSEQYFFILYSCAIGLAFLMISLVLNNAPKITSDVVEAARETYAVSTLSNIDSNKALQDLQKLMRERKLYKENTIDLYTVATELGLTHHQLSELVNTCMGKSFSRYIREYRVEEAQQLLKNNLKSSVLSIGLSVGFTSQSNFYEAFREIVGSTPGKYRKLNK